MKRAVLAALSICVLATCGSSGSRRENVGEIGVFGPVCGSSTIMGVAQEPITSSTSRLCGISQPVRVAEVSGIKLAQQPLLNCTAARALNRWVSKSAKPAVADIDEKLVSLRVVAHYACRPRNSQRGARISEHGKGNAIDIAGFGLASGGELSVLRDWSRGDEGRALSQMRRGACGPFGVVLGPGSDRFHRDHFHFDVSNLGRPYCR